MPFSSRSSRTSRSGDVAASLSRRSSAAAEATQDRLLNERYDRYAARYDRAFAAYSHATLSRAMELLGTPLPRRVLDLACGTGLLARRILETDSQTEVIGVDVSSAMLAEAKRNLDRTQRVSFLEGRAESIPLGDRSVQAIVIANAFHLVRDPAAALCECRRVLVPGGTLVIVDWCRDALAMRALATLLMMTQRLERRIEGLRAVTARISAAGFRVTEAFRFSARPAWGLMGIRATLHTPHALPA